MNNEYSEQMQTTMEMVSCLRKFGLEGVFEYGMTNAPLTYQVSIEGSDEKAVVVDTMRGMPVTNKEFFSKVQESLESVIEYGMFDSEPSYSDWENLRDYAYGNIH